MTSGEATALIPPESSPNAPPRLTRGYRSARATPTLEQARATERAALAGWDVAVLRSLREVETALATYDAD
jgi:hypothetical protein